MVDYIKLRQQAARINAEIKGGTIPPVPPAWGDVLRPQGVSRPRWYEDINTEGT